MPGAICGRVLRDRNSSHDPSPVINQLDVKGTRDKDGDGLPSASDASVFSISTHQCRMTSVVRRPPRRLVAHSWRSHHRMRTELLQMRPRQCFEASSESTPDLLQVVNAGRRDPLLIVSLWVSKPCAKFERFAAMRCWHFPRLLLLTPRYSMVSNCMSSDFSAALKPAFRAAHDRDPQMPNVYAVMMHANLEIAGSQSRVRVDECLRLLHARHNHLGIRMPRQTASASAATDVPVKSSPTGRHRARSYTQPAFSHLRRSTSDHPDSAVFDEWDEHHPHEDIAEGDEHDEHDNNNDDGSEAPRERDFAAIEARSTSSEHTLAGETGQQSDLSNAEKGNSAKAAAKEPPSKPRATDPGQEGIKRRKTQAGVPAEKREWPDNIVTFDSPDDPCNPKNWPSRKKIIITMLFGMTTMCSTFASSVYSPAVTYVSAEYGISSEVAILGLSLFVLGYVPVRRLAYCLRRRLMGMLTTAGTGMPSMQAL